MGAVRLKSPVPWTAIALLVMTGLALLFGAPVSRITEIAIYTLYGAGVAVLIAYTGLVPFGASVFFGLGSYAAALIMLHVSGNEIAGLAGAVLFSVALAFLLGLLVLRRRGLYFSLLTLAASQIAFEVVFRWTALTGGENGLQDVPRPLLGNRYAFHAFACLVVLAVLGALWRFVHAPVGRALQGVRDNEQRMASLGYDTWALKLGAFTITGGVVGLAGALLTILIQGAYPNNLGWQHAGDPLLMVVLGGVHDALGPLWGAAAFILLEDRLSALFENWWLLFAPIIIVFVLAGPEGLHGLMRRLTRRRGWTLVRPGLPAMPTPMVPFAAGRAPVDLLTPVLTVRGLEKRFGSTVVARGIDLDVMPGRLHSLIGPNGAGKTTFFNMLSGIMPPDAGVVRFGGVDITRLSLAHRARLGLGRSFQIVSVFQNLTAFENVRLAVQHRFPERRSVWRDAYAIEAINSETWSLLAAVGLERRAGETCAALSHGERRLLEIAITLGTDAKLLLLDEPLAGLSEPDRVVVSQLIRRLADTHAVLLVEHDLDRVVAISDRITVLHQGAILADGDPAQVVRDPAVVAAYLGKSAGQASVVVPMPARAKAPRPALLTVERLVAGYGGSVVLDGIDLAVAEGEAVALLGRNGVGKTTVLRAIMGAVKATSGRIVFGADDITGTARHLIARRGVAIVPEGRRLFPNLTIRDNLLIAQRRGGLTLTEAYRLFPRLEERAGVLAQNVSGGEKQMGAIARALMAPARLILLDEPFEGLAPAVVTELMDAIQTLRTRMAIILVEHHAEQVLSVVDRAYVLVNGQVAYEGTSAALAADHDLQARLLGVVEPVGAVA